MSTGGDIVTAPLVLAAADGYFALVGDDDQPSHDRIAGRMTVESVPEYVVGFTAARPVMFTLPPDSGTRRARVGFYAADGRRLWTSAWSYGLTAGDTVSVPRAWSPEPRRVG